MEFDTPLCDKFAGVSLFGQPTAILAFEVSPLKRRINAAGRCAIGCCAKKGADRSFLESHGSDHADTVCPGVPVVTLAEEALIASEKWKTDRLLKARSCISSHERVELHR